MIMQKLIIPDIFKKDYDEIRQHILKNKVFGKRKYVPEEIQIIAALLSSYRGMWLSGKK